MTHNCLTVQVFSCLSGSKRPGRNWLFDSPDVFRQERRLDASDEEISIGPLSEPWVRHRGDAMKETKAAAIYARVSTVDKGQDPAMQVRELREYCRRRGWRVSAEYVDRASG